jgi:3-deoxy-D-manno-octulosonate 8-phosphate phosphatase (KDO 8-P phosphatase)
MAVHPTVTLLVRNREKSARFYEKSLGYGLVWDTLLVGPYGQSLRLLEVSGGPTGGCVVHAVEVPDVSKAVSAIIDNGGARGENYLHDQPLYVGPDGELILLSQRGLANAEAVKLIVYDFDGVMTDNRVFVDENGCESVAANRSDGLAIGMIRALGIDQCILSTEENPVVSARAAKLKIEATQSVTDKKSALVELAQTKGLALAEVMYMGNDVNDVAAMEQCGLKVAPADAHPVILAIADYVTEAPGGHGAVRELADVLAAGRKVVLS